MKADKSSGNEHEQLLNDLVDRIASWGEGVSGDEAIRSVAADVRQLRAPGREPSRLFSKLC